MARKRMLDPNFFKSYAVNELSIEAAMTFAGLWCYCDDKGRGELDVDLIKAEVWPRRKEITTRKIQNHLAQINAQGMTCHYSVGGVDLLHCTSWNEHQKPQHATPSKLPPCAEHQPEQYEEFMNGNGDALERFRIKEREILAKRVNGS